MPDVGAAAGGLPQALKAAGSTAGRGATGGTPYTGKAAQSPPGGQELFAGFVQDNVQDLCQAHKFGQAVPGLNRAHVLHCTPVWHAFPVSR